MLNDSTRQSRAAATSNELRVSKIIQEKDVNPSMTIIEILEATRLQEEAENKQFGQVEANKMRLRRYLEEREAGRQRMQARERDDENARFFNLPTAFADLEHWAKLDIWTVDEAIAISMGKEPRLVNLENVSPFAAESAFAKEYIKRTEMAQRAKLGGALTDPCKPEEFIQWAVRKGLPLPVVLEGLVSRYAKNSVASDLRRDLMKVTTERDALQAQLDGLNRIKRPEAAAKEQHSVNVVIFAAAIKRYRYDPLKPRNDATGIIKRDIEDLGLALDDETILKILRNAASDVERTRLKD